MTDERHAPNRHDDYYRLFLPQSGWFMPICVGGSLRWVAPAVPGLKVEEGRVQGTPVMVVTGDVPGRGSSSSPLVGVDLLSADGTVSGLGFSDVTVSITSSAVHVTGVLGRLNVERDVTVNSDGAWRVGLVKPVGPAVPSLGEVG